MAVLIGGLALFGLSSWYDLEVTTPSQDSHTADVNGVGGLGLWLLIAAGLLVVGVLILVMGILTFTMLSGSRVASRLACGLAAGFALSCGALSLFGSDDTQLPRQDPNTIAPMLDHDPRAPKWASWSEVAGQPVFIVGAALVTVVLLLPSTRRDLHARRRPTEATEEDSGPPYDRQ
jgi:hypothetical protein